MIINYKVIFYGSSKMSVYTVFSRVLTKAHGNHRGELAEAGDALRRAEEGLKSVRAATSDPAVIRPMEEIVLSASLRVDRAAACIRREAELRDKLGHAISAMAYIQSKTLKEEVTSGHTVRVMAGWLKGRWGKVIHTETTSWGTIMCHLSMLDTQEVEVVESDLLSRNGEGT